jgi:PAS domain S-box-containing protein
MRPEEMAGKTDYDFSPKELAEKYRSDDRHVMQTGQTEALDEKHLQDGREGWVHTVKTPVRNENGEVTGVFGIFWDITERKLAGEKLRLRE